MDSQGRGGDRGAGRGLDLVVFHLVLVAATIAFKALLIRNERVWWIANEIGPGRLLRGTLHGVIFIALSTLLSVRLSGFFSAGTSPLGIGKKVWATGFGYAAFLLSTTLPYAAIAWWEGGLTIADVAIDYATQLVYANLVILCVLATSVLVDRRAAVPLTTIAAAGVAALGCLRVPNLVAHVGPVRIFLGPIFDSESGAHLQRPSHFPEPTGLDALWTTDAHWAPLLWLIIGSAIAGLLAARRRLLRSTCVWILFIIIEILGVALTFDPNHVRARAAGSVAHLAIWLIIMPILIFDIVLLGRSNLFFACGIVMSFALAFAPALLNAWRPGLGGSLIAEEVPAFRSFFLLAFPVAAIFLVEIHLLARGLSRILSRRLHTIIVCALACLASLVFLPACFGGNGPFESRDGILTWLLLAMPEPAIRMAARGRPYLRSVPVDLAPFYWIHGIALVLLLAANIVLWIRSRRRRVMGGAE